jgi:hypothetical protein
MQPFALLAARCSHSTRREFLVQSAGAFGLTFLLPGLDFAAAGARGPERGKSLITLWLDGGPSQLETWDAHPGTKIGGPAKSIPTKIPGLQIADLYPHVAEQIDALTVIRSLVSKEGDHERGRYYLKTGYRPDPTLKHPSLGAVLAHELPDATIEIPMHVSLCANANAARGGFLGDRYDAFKLFNPGENVRNMQSRVRQPNRTQRRLANLEVVSEAFSRQRRVAVDRTLHRHVTERAMAMMRSEQLKAFQLDDESQETRDAYGDTRFGRGCLVARRLVEQGVRAVEVTLQGFDSHANNFEAHRENSKILDPALASLVGDLRQRDLLDSTVVLCIGEFGRTPNINPLEGRDHWPHGFSCLVGGGGLRSGLVLGGTDPTGEKQEPEHPIEVADLFATLFKVFGVDFEREYMTPIGRPMAVSSGTPCKQLL